MSEILCDCCGKHPADRLVNGKRGIEAACRRCASKPFCTLCGKRGRVYLLPKSKLCARCYRSLG